MYNYICIYLSLSIFLSFYLSVCLSIYPSIYLSIDFIRFLYLYLFGMSMGLCLSSRLVWGMKAGEQVATSQQIVKRLWYHEGHPKWRFDNGKGRAEGYQERTLQSISFVNRNSIEVPAKQASLWQSQEDFSWWAPRKICARPFQSRHRTGTSQARRWPSGFYAADAWHSLAQFRPLGCAES